MAYQKENNEIGLRYVNENGKILGEEWNAKEHKREKEGTYDYLSLGSELFDALQLPTGKDSDIGMTNSWAENRKVVYMEKYTSKNVLASHLRKNDIVLDRFWSLEKATDYIQNQLVSTIKPLKHTW